MNFVMFLSEQNKKEKYERDKTHKQKIINCRGGGGGNWKKKQNKKWDQVRGNRAMNRLSVSSGSNCTIE